MKKNLTPPKIFSEEELKIEQDFRNRLQEERGVIDKLNNKVASLHQKMEEINQMFLSIRSRLAADQKAYEDNTVEKVKERCPALCDMYDAYEQAWKEANKELEKEIIKQYLSHADKIISRLKKWALENNIMTPSQ